MQKRKTTLFLISILLFITLFSTISIGMAYSPDMELYKAKVVEVDNDNRTPDGYGYQNVKVRITSGEYKGEIVSIQNFVEEVMIYNVTLKKGDSIYCMLQFDDNGEILMGYFYEFRRDQYMYALVVLFIITMLVVGGVKGLKSLATLIITFIGVFMMLNGIIKGSNPILLSIIVGTVITILTILIISGFNRKSTCAIIGTIAGVVIAASLALVMSKLSNLTGLSSMEAQMLVYNTNFDFKGILFASILLGTLGAVMDVCMSIASAINELIIANHDLTPMDLFKSGMNIGRDVMGTMANTLILAYIGSSMFLMLVFLVNDVRYLDIINLDLIATEIVRALTGTIGIVAALPITAIISAYVEKGASMNFLKKQNKIN